MDKNILFPHLRGAMASKGITITKLAELTGMGKSTLSNKLNGHTEFNLKDIKTIKDVLNITDVENIFFN